MLNVDAMMPMGDMNVENRRGPKTEPWGTPEVQLLKGDDD
jgi:hypothetical protein